MKNDTKVRLHLSKALFESLTKQVLTEGKMKKEALGGYTEVKAPKANKSAEKMTDRMKKMEEVDAIADTKRMQKTHKVDEKMSSKEKMAKGLYKEDFTSEVMPILITFAAGGGALAAAFARDIKNAKTPEEKKQVLKNAAQQILQSKGIENEGALNESPVMDSIMTAVGVLGSGALSAVIMKLQDILKKKDPEAYKKLQGVRGTMGGANPSLDV